MKNLLRLFCLALLGLCLGSPTLEAAMVKVIGTPDSLESADPLFRNQEFLVNASNTYQLAFPSPNHQRQFRQLMGKLVQVEGETTAPPKNHPPSVLFVKVSSFREVRPGGANLMLGTANALAGMNALSSADKQVRIVTPNAVKSFFYTAPAGSRNSSFVDNQRYVVEWKDEVTAGTTKSQITAFAPSVIVPLIPEKPVSLTGFVKQIPLDLMNAPGRQGKTINVFQANNFSWPISEKSTALNPNQPAPFRKLTIKGKLQETIPLEKYQELFIESQTDAGAVTTEETGYFSPGNPDLKIGSSSLLTTPWETFLITNPSPELLTQYGKTIKLFGAPSPQPNSLGFNSIKDVSKFHNFTERTPLEFTGIVRPLATGTPGPGQLSPRDAGSQSAIAMLQVLGTLIPLTAETGGRTEREIKNAQGKLVKLKGLYALPGGNLGTRVILSVHSLELVSNPLMELSGTVTGPTRGDSPPREGVFYLQTGKNRVLLTAGDDLAPLLQLEKRLGETAVVTGILAGNADQGPPSFKVKSWTLPR